MIKLTINGERALISEKLSILDLLTRDRKIEPSQVAIEHNGKILSRESWKETLLKEGDKLEILSFVGGG
ncbi:MAG: sulfur carrier protein ThiS [Brevinematales bacterium]|jgi:thiamine biosynthesis protein ThiS